MRHTSHRLLALLLCLAGCSAADADLLVELRTDYVPGHEVAIVETRVETLEGALVARSETRLRPSDDAASGVTVGAFEGVAPGSYHIDVALLDASGARLAGRPIRAQIGVSRVVTVVLNRACGAVSCGDSEACFDGRCVDALCSVESPRACGPVSCEVDADCGAPDGCAVARCESGACLQVADHAACEAEAWCHPERGCSTSVIEPGGCAMELSGELLEDLTVPAGCVLSVPSELYVAGGAQLTLQAGVRVELAPTVSIHVGYVGSCRDEECAGALTADGAADAPVVFTSAVTEPAPGDWGALIFHRETLGPSRVSHARLEYAGDDELAAITVERVGEQTPGAIAIEDCTFEHNAGLGVRAAGHSGGYPVAGLFAAFERNVFRDSRDYAIAIAANVLDTVSSDNELDAPVLVDGEGTIDHATAWPDLRVPFVVADDITLRDSASLWMPPAGGTVQMLSGTQVRIRQGGVQATSVTFESGTPAPLGGDWRGFLFESAAGASRFDGCTFRHAGMACASTYCGVLDIGSAAQRVRVEASTFADNIGMRDIWAGRAELCAPYLSAGNTFDLTSCE